MPAPVTNSVNPVGRIEPIFQAQINKLNDTNRTIYESSIGLAFPITASGHQRVWQMPDSGTGWDGNLFNLSGPSSIAAAYDRSAANAIYRRALTQGAQTIYGEGGPVGEGRLADCMVEKIQIDYLAAQERAFRMRHASSIRCQMHAMARRRGQSTWADVPAGSVPADQQSPGYIGGIFTTMIRYLLLLLNDGYSYGNVDINRDPTTTVQDATGLAEGWTPGQFGAPT